MRESEEGIEIMCPIRLDGYINKEWEDHRKPDIINRVVGDFGNWRDAERGVVTAKYREAFGRLLKALTA
jgi:hypothetical protein